MGSQVSSGAASAAEVREVVDQIRQLVRALRLSAGEAERATGLSSAQLFVLQTLGEAPGISLSELADRTSTDQSSVSVVVQRLVSLGLVARGRDQTDARRLQLRLSRRGSELLKKAPPMAQQKLIGAVQRLSPRDRRQVARSLQAMVATLDIPSGIPPMFFENEVGDE